MCFCQARLNLRPSQFAWRQLSDARSSRRRCDQGRASAARTTRSGSDSRRKTARVKTGKLSLDLFDLRAFHHRQLWLGSTHAIFAIVWSPVHDGTLLSSLPRQTVCTAGAHLALKHALVTRSSDIRAEPFLNLPPTSQPRSLALQNASRQSAQCGVGAPPTAAAVQLDAPCSSASRPGPLAASVWQLRCARAQHLSLRLALAHNVSSSRAVLIAEEHAIPTITGIAGTPAPEINIE